MVKDGVYMIDMPKTSGNKKLKRRHRTVIFSSDKLFVSPELAGMGERIAFMCCSADGESVVSTGKHIYVSVDWLKKEKPHMASELEKFEKMVRESCLEASGR